MDFKAFTPQSIVNAFIHKEYILKDGIWRLNLIGIRASGGATNTFNDAIGCLTMDDQGTRRLFLYQGTTDPGLYWLDHPGNPLGTAILQATQHIDSHTVGMHKGLYRALVQNKPLTVWRDADKDGQYDYSHPDSGMFGINIHRAQAFGDAPLIQDWSAGCQVVQDPKDFDTIMNLVDVHIGKTWGKVFTYTLFDEEDISLA